MVRGRSSRERTRYSHKSSLRGDPPQEGMITPRSQPFILSRKTCIDSSREEKIMMHRIDFHPLLQMTLIRLRNKSSYAQSSTGKRRKCARSTYIQNFTTKEIAKDLFQPVSNHTKAGGNSPRVYLDHFNVECTQIEKLTIISSPRLFAKRPRRRHTVRKESNKKTSEVYGKDPRMLP
ncbi:hypothetical protein PIB30_014641 [Stylosanthes scabra]|uniref:Uncharacterized protein n=1 Tax=Stylosanthes scabra TaxID=79078 RepID=A0ABU6S724_9FABA|nr:hypothetical protein [Stylosanthes scabra]